MGRGNRKWRLKLVPALIAAVALTGIGLMTYPAAASWVSQYNQSKIVGSNLVRVQTNGEDASQLTKAEKYNNLLEGGAVYSADKNVPTSANGQSMHSLYLKALDADDTGLMGRIQIPSIAVDLPLYHGTSDATLLEGVGHLEGTSLPIGGEGTHSVLTGHRGLASARMFTDLNRVEKGDRFTISTADRVVFYQVISIKTVDPDQTRSLAPVTGKDLVTLVTCTPLGINSQRIFVTGERVYPTPKIALAAAQKVPTLPYFPWWTLVVGSSLLAAGFYLWRTGLGPVTPKRQGRAGTGGVGGPSSGAGVGGGAGVTTGAGSGG